MMTQLKSPFLKEAAWRGFIHQGTDLEGLDNLMASGSITAYIGFDATAASLHVGSLSQIMWLRLLQKHGHKPLVLMGDGTTQIGDPSGKDTSRQLLTPIEIEHNVSSIQRIFSNYLTFGDKPHDALLVRNSQWLLPLNYIEFLRNYGAYFTINRMLTFDSVRLRLDREQPLTFLEFNYMILQAYDFLELYRLYGCKLQLGGSDQWGNIVNGVDLIRRLEAVDAYGLTNPLITTSDGAKMGKTAKGAVWLSSELLSPYDFWQYWRNTQDSDVGRFLRLFTDMPQGEIQKLESLQGAEINEAKKVLADEVTRLCHGEDALQQARGTAEKLFEAASSEGLDNLPTVYIEAAELGQGILAVELFRRTGLVTSNSEARRLIRGQGARINDTLIHDETLLIKESHLTPQGHIKLSAGKKKHALIKMRV
jgi:tyrosyl-tRNA synthetase